MAFSLIYHFMLGMGASESGGSAPSSSAGRFMIRLVGTETFAAFDVSEAV